MFCENCGNKMNDGDLFCTNCGWKVTEDMAQESVSEQPTVETQEPVEAQEPVQAQEPVLNEQTVVEEEIAQEEAVESTEEAEKVAEDAAAETVEVEAAEQPVMGGQVPQHDTVVPTAIPTSSNGEQKQQKTVKMPSKKVCIFGGAAVAVVLIVVLIASCFGKVTNFVMKTFSSPGKYYQYVEKKEVAEQAASMANIYQNLFLSNADVNDRSFDGKFSFELSKEGLKELEDIADTTLDIDDLSCIKESSVTVNTNVKDSVISGSGKLTLGKTDIISGEVIFDAKEGALYVKVPEMYDKYVAIEDIGDELGIYYDSEDMEEVIASVENVYDKCPDKKVVEKLLYKYLCTAIECIDDVEKESTEIDAEDISQRCTQLKATVDSETMAEMVTSVLKQMKSDKELKKVILDVASVSEDVDPEDVYEEFTDTIDNAIDNADAIEDSKSKIVMSVFIDDSGKIIGRQIKMRDEYDQITMTYKMPERGGKFGLEISYDDGSDSFEFAGSGKKHGSKLNGEFDCKIDNQKVFEVEVADYDTNKIKEGYIDGNFIFKLKGGYYGAAAVLSKYRIGFDVCTSANEINVATTVYDGDEKWATLSADMKKGKGKKVSIPSGKNVKTVEDEDELLDVLEDVKFDKIKANLKKAKVPSEVIDAIEDIEDFM